MKQLLVLLMIISIYGCMPVEKDNEITFSLVNNSDIDRDNEPVLLLREVIEAHTSEWPEDLQPVVYDSADNVIPQQHDDMDGDGTWDEIAFVTAVPAQGAVSMKIKFTDLSMLPDFEERTNVHFGVKNTSGEVEPVTEYSLPAENLPRGDNKIFQMDGPAWENDLVGYRHYFDGRNTRDLFGKTTRAMVLDKVGLQEGEIF
ncbi:MAG: DUF4861 family protein, partial [Cyclobacteriaceae bacterium]